MQHSICTMHTLHEQHCFEVSAISSEIRLVVRVDIVLIYPYAPDVTRGSGLACAFFNIVRDFHDGAAKLSGHAGRNILPSFARCNTMTNNGKQSSPLTLSVSSACTVWCLRYA